MSKYQYRATYRGARKVAPEVLAAELEQIRLDGELTARRVVDAAKPEVAPLHPAFEWDDDKAADEFRLIQARTLIRAIVVTEEEEDRPPMSVYVHVPDAEEPSGKYMPTEIVIEDIEEYERALTDAQRYLTSAEHRFHELRALAEKRGGRAEVLAIAMQGFSAVREALTLLKTA